MLKEYLKLKLEFEAIERKKNKIRDKIIKVLKSMPGKNEEKELIEKDLKAFAVYRESIEWSNKGIKLVEKLYPKCIKKKVDNYLLEKLCDQKNIKKLDKLRKISWNSPILYVKPVKEE